MFADLPSIPLPPAPVPPASPAPSAAIAAIAAALTDDADILTRRSTDPVWLRAVASDLEHLAARLRKTISQP